MSEETLETADPVEVSAEAPQAAEPAAKEVGLSSLLEGDEKQPEASAAPEKYELNVYESKDFDADAFSAVARELGLSQESAQKMVDAILPTMAQKQGERAQALTQQLVTSLKEELTKDPEVGGENLRASAQLADKAVKQFGTSELRAILNNGPIGVHPEMIRFLARVGKAISEDAFVQGSTAKPGDEATLKAMYEGLV